jgi:hypothetical protein
LHKKARQKASFLVGCNGRAPKEQGGEIYEKINRAAKIRLVAAKKCRKKQKLGTKCLVILDLF